MNCRCHESEPGTKPRTPTATRQDSAAACRLPGITIFRQSRFEESGVKNCTSRTIKQQRRNEKDQRAPASCKSGGNQLPGGEMGHASPACEWRTQGGLKKHENSRWQRKDRQNCAGKARHPSPHRRTSCKKPAENNQGHYHEMNCCQFDRQMQRTTRPPIAISAATTCLWRPKVRLWPAPGKPLNLFRQSSNRNRVATAAITRCINSIEISGRGKILPVSGPFRTARAETRARNPTVILPRHFSTSCF